MDVASIKGEIVSSGTLWSMDPDTNSKTKKHLYEIDYIHFTFNYEDH